ncbi:MAG: family 10 glycosylhydrolase, partial [Leptolyngbyaceae bacterium]|nr:family 10 glycosylhydrolase [Leptolyngbyaceae bacterium]
MLCSSAFSIPISLGVVQNQENKSHWESIKTRLEASDIPYRPVDLKTIRSAEDLADMTVLFLPNIETIHVTQVLALEAWMRQGGRLIVSGSVGNLSSLGVRQVLRSLLGAYWSTPLTQPSLLQLTANPTQSGGTQKLTSSRVWGGVLMPIGLDSQTLATWQSLPQPEPRTTAKPAPLVISPAIIATERSTFLGWNWGDRSSGSVEFDSAWLKATLSRYREEPIPSQARQSMAPTAPSANPNADPAEQVAPAGLEVELSALPINILEAITMRQELERLIGRVESAILSANAINSPVSLVGKVERSPTPVTSVVAQLPGASSKETTVEIPLPTLKQEALQLATAPNLKVSGLNEARNLLKSFSALIAEKDYRGARQQWLQARKILWDSYPMDHFQAQSEVRAMWLDRGTIVRAGSEAKLGQIFDQLASSGINTVFFETLNAGYPIYPSRVAPQQNPLVKGWDPLASAVKLAHERGMELHAWVWVFATGNNRHNALVNLPDDYLGPVLTAHPDWANYDNRGEEVPLGQGKPFLDPANPAVRDYLTRLYSEIVTRYPVDGLQLDYIRYPFQDPGADRTYGYGLAAREQFQKLTGVDPVDISPRDRIPQVPLTPRSPKPTKGKPQPPSPPPSPAEIQAMLQRNRQLWQLWTEFRIQQVNSFVADISKHLRQLRPNLILSAAVFPLPEAERLRKIQQHWEVWARRGDIDLIVPMSYALDTNRFQRLVEPYLTEVDVGPALILPGIRLLNLPEAMAIDQLQSLRDLPSKGYALFAAQDLNTNLQDIFNKTQGSIRRVPREPIPYRQPFWAAHARYTALKREWSFLLGTNQLRIREPALSNWQTQATRLEQDLNQLALRPSVEQLTKTHES